MPLPKPTSDESQDAFMERCMGDDVMVDEYPDEKQRYKVCEAQWEKSQDARVAASYECECIECGHKETYEDHCNEHTCPECGGQMRRVGTGHRSSSVFSTSPGPTSGSRSGPMMSP